MFRWVMILVLLLASCGGPHSIVYRITGTTGNVDVTLVNASGGTEQRNVKPPYEVAFNAQSGQVLSISGQNKWDAGEVTCEIIVDGKVAQAATSTAAFGIASCSGRI